MGGYRRRSVITPRRRFPGVDVVVHTRGVGGRSAAQMLARFDRDIWPLNPHLVPWQSGTIEALRRTPLDTLRHDLEDGIARIRGHGIEVVPIKRQVAGAAGVPLVDRYAAMADSVAAIIEAAALPRPWPVSSPATRMPPAWTAGSSPTASAPDRQI